MNINLSEDNIKIIIGALNIYELNLAKSQKSLESKLTWTTEIERTSKELDIVKRQLKRVRNTQNVIRKTGVII